MSETMNFANREEFREWLREHCLSDDLDFQKTEISCSLNCDTDSSLQSREIRS